MNVNTLFHSLSEDEKKDLLILIMNEKAIRADSKDAMKINDFLWKQKMSVRLKSSLHKYIKAFGNIPINEVNSDNMLRLRNVGKSSVDEFKKLRGY